MLQYKKVDSPRHTKLAAARRAKTTKNSLNCPFYLNFERKTSKQSPLILGNLTLNEFASAVINKLIY